MEVINKGVKPDPNSVPPKSRYEVECSNCGFHAIDQSLDGKDLIKECPTCGDLLKWYMNNLR